MASYRERVKMCNQGGPPAGTGAVSAQQAGGFPWRNTHIPPVGRLSSLNPGQASLERPIATAVPASALHSTNTNLSQEFINDVKQKLKQACCEPIILDLVQRSNKDAVLKIMKEVLDEVFEPPKNVTTAPPSRPQDDSNATYQSILKDSDMFT